MTSRGERLLVVDVGTTGTRAVIFDLGGCLLGRAYREYKSRFLPAGAIDHDADTWLRAVDATIPEVLQRTATSPDRCLAIAVTGQRATVVPVSSSGEPLAPAILWQDKRTLKQCRQIESRVGSDVVYARTGLRVDPYFSLPKLMWYRDELPEVYRAAHCFLTAHDLIVHHLTGQFRTDWTQASRTMLFDVVASRWDPDLAQACGIDLHRLPESLGPGAVGGRLACAAAARLGLPQGLPVVMAGGDQQAAAIGLGAIHGGLASVTTGTGTFVLAATMVPIWDAKRRVLLSASSVGGQWVLEAGILTSGAVYRWLRDVLLGEATRPGDVSGDPYEYLDALASQARAGAGGVTVLPHFAGSAAPTWDVDARGVIFNLALGHRLPDLARAILEGIALEVMTNLSIMEGLLCGRAVAGVDQHFQEIRVGGGACRSDLFNGIQADVYGRRVVPGKAKEMTALGAAILAAVTAGVYPDVAAACQAMSGLDIARAQEPDQRNHEVYQRLSRLHAAIYEALAQSGTYRMAAELARGT